MIDGKIDIIGSSYKPGYTGFTYNDNSFISDGIIFFTKEPEYIIPVSHCFIVKDNFTGIEASVGGVQEFRLAKYFTDLHTHVVFKKPFNLQPEDVEVMLAEADARIGNKYDYSLFCGFILRWMLRPLENSKWLRKKPSVFDSRYKDICSELIAILLKTRPKYISKDPLNEYHPSKITPLKLFYSDKPSLWEPWHYNFYRKEGI